jgi:hypothetical protein
MGQWRRVLHDLEARLFRRRYREPGFIPFAKRCPEKRDPFWLGSRHYIGKPQVSRVFHLLMMVIIMILVIVLRVLVVMMVRMRLMNLPLVTMLSMAMLMQTDHHRPGTVTEISDTAAERKYPGERHEGEGSGKAPGE